MKPGTAVFAIIGIVCAGIFGAIVALAPAWVSPVGAADVDRQSSPQYGAGQSAETAERNRASTLGKIEVELSEVRTRAEVDRIVEEWRLKIDRFTQSAADTTAAGFEKTKAKLDSAWNGVEREWTDLKTATKDEWNGAQTSFDEAIDELKRVWQEVAG